ncbi:MAG: hypothetical protein EZS28_018395, partial [Streblomastix strix]
YNRFSPRIKISTTVNTDQHNYSQCDVIILDTLLEKQLGIGREWTYSDPIPSGTTIITQELAIQANISIGDVINFQLLPTQFASIVPDIIYKGLTKTVNASYSDQ